MNVKQISLDILVEDGVNIANKVIELLEKNKIICIGHDVNDVTELYKNYDMTIYR